MVRGDEMSTLRDAGMSMSMSKQERRANKIITLTVKLADKKVKEKNNDRN